MNEKEKLKNSVEEAELLTQCLAPRFGDGNTRPCTEDDYIEFLSKTRSIWKKLETTFCDQNINNSSLCNKQVIAPLIMLFGENNKRFPWNTNESFESCKRIRTAVLDSMNTTEGALLVEGISRGKGMELRPLLKPVLLALRPKLLKETWKEHPSAVECFVWLLNEVKTPHLADHLQHVLPTALLLVDDFVNENRVIGVRCLSRIIQDMTTAELKFHGHGEVIYKALESLLREKNAALARELLPCILNLTLKLETDFGDVEPSYKWSRLDDMMEILLETIQLEDRIALRTIYISSMTKIITALGNRVYRWSKRIISILDHYLEVAATLFENESMLHALKALHLFLQMTEPDQAYYRQDVLFTLFRLLYHLCDASVKKNINTDVREETIKCLTLVLSGCTPAEIQTLVDDTRKECSDHQVARKIVEILEETCLPG